MPRKKTETVPLVPGAPWVLLQLVDAPDGQEIIFRGGGGLDESGVARILAAALPQAVDVAFQRVAAVAAQAARGESPAGDAAD